MMLQTASTDNDTRIPHDAKLTKSDIIRKKSSLKLRMPINYITFAALFGVIADGKLRVACYVALER
jgi:hypothetical protein